MFIRIKEENQYGLKKASHPSELVHHLSNQLTYNMHALECEPSQYGLIGPWQQHSTVTLTCAKHTHIDVVTTCMHLSVNLLRTP